MKSRIPPSRSSLPPEDSYHTPRIGRPRVLDHGSGYVGVVISPAQRELLEEYRLQNKLGTVSAALRHLIDRAFDR